MMKKVRTTLGALGLAAAMVLPLSGALNAGAADGAWEGGPVTIRVELDNPQNEGSSGPLVQQVEGVVPGPQVELTSADVISNPSKWRGTVQVDIDPDTHRIYVATGQVPGGPTIKVDEELAPPVPPIDQLSPGYRWDGGYFQTAKVTISGAGFETFTTVSDDLWQFERPDAKPAFVNPQLVPQISMDLSTSLTAGDALASWVSNPPDWDLYLAPAGQAVFEYGIAEEPTTTTTPTTTEPDTTEAPATAEAPPTSTAPAAQAVTSSPTYTG